VNKPWKIVSTGKGHTGRRGRAQSACRRLGIERLEDRRVLSGVSPLAGLPPVISGPTRPAIIATPVTPWPTGGSQGGTTSSPETLSAAQLAAETVVGQSINSFAEALYSRIQSQLGGSGNLFLSPASISTALAMTYAGAEGETATQMAAALHYTLAPNALAGDFSTLITDLNSAGQNNYSLSVADALWGQQGYSFLTPFLSLMQADYGGGLHQVDFMNATEAARQTINNWVAQQTNNKIQNLIPAGALNALTRLVLTNAIYFKGQWATPFNANLTQNAAFTLGSGGQVQVPTMQATNSYGYMQSDGYQVLELPYAGNRMVMDVLLPSGSGVSGLDASQLPADLNGWLQGLTMQQVDVSLPKFQITTPAFNVTQSLEALGMTDAFNPTAADFSGISTNPLYISAVYHKAFVDIDENGTEAAAATAVIITSTAIAMPITPPVVFNADHPFLFLIRDTQSGSVLFMGQVADPSSTGTDPSAPAVPTAQPVAAPRITSAAPTQAGVGHVYSYQIQASASSSQTITFSLGFAPAGMSVNASTGLVTWSPTVLQTGSTAVTVLATDQFGNTVRQAFSISVSGAFSRSNPFGPAKQNSLTIDGLWPASLKSNALDQFFVG